MGHDGHNDGALTLGDIRQLDRERRMLLFLPALLLMAIFMALLVKSLLDNKAQINRTLFAHLANDFLVHVTMVRTEWMVSGRPERATYRETQFAMSNQGYPWIKSVSGELDCHQLWLSLMDIPLTLNQTPIAVVTIEDSVNNLLWCRYQLDVDVFFDYSPDNGTLLLSENLT